MSIQVQHGAVSGTVSLSSSAPQSIGAAAAGVSTDASRADHVHAGAHSALSGVGANSHGTIDAHLAATAAHGVSGNIVGTTDIQTLTNKTLTTPTVADFTNAQHDHLDADDGGLLTQAATHQSPDTDSGTSALHHTLGTGANQAAAGNHTHTQKSMLGGPGTGTVAAGGTRYCAPYNATQYSSETSARLVVPFDCVAKNLYVRTGTAQPGGGSFVLTILKNGSATAITITIAAGAAAGKFSDVTNSGAFTGGDELALRLVNNDGGAASASITTWSLELDVTG